MYVLLCGASIAQAQENELL